MADSQVNLTQEEREFLVGLLTTRVGDIRVEVHHTHTPDYRDQVIREEKFVRDLLAKLSG